MSREGSIDGIYYLKITVVAVFIALASLYSFRFFEPRQVHYGNICLQGGDGYFVRASADEGYFEIQKFLSPGSVISIGREFQTYYEKEHYEAHGEVFKGRTFIDIAASSESELDRLKRQIVSGCSH